MTREENLKDFEDFYIIDSNGNIYNKKNGYKLKVLNQYRVSRGYPYYILNKNGERFVKKIHRLVAIQFLNNENNLPIVNHIDGNKLNFNVNNLEWVTYSENSKYNYKIGLQKPKFGEENPMYGKIPYNKGIKTNKPSWNRGLKHSEESKKKMSENRKNKGGLKGNEHPNYGKPAINNRKIIAINILTNEIIDEFISVKQAGELLPISYSSVKKILSGNIKSIKNIMVKYKD
jgi:hypothetical protein